jgi:hypothetical protein
VTFLLHAITGFLVVVGAMGLAVVPFLAADDAFNRACDFSAKQVRQAKRTAFEEES